MIIKHFANILTIAIVLICAGCDRNMPSQDSAKLEELSKKIDVMSHVQVIMWSNQLTIWDELEAVRSTVTNLPSTRTVNSISYYYHTNAVFSIEDDLDNHIRFYGTNIQATQLEAWMQFWQSKQANDVNQLDTYKAIKEGQINQDVDGIDMKIDEMSDDMTDVKNDVEQLQADTQKIKTRLGIIY